ncbi:uncharacterized protein LOC129215097 isoform X2 [Grus americana]|uniref:uncharacterized protein LOC129215097 isoform X2 n=1 Tax=Grus americana TaxID=9117 RepID=UPI002407A97F|nr:uncharacterized protein LOC129215097 isoform X2 [Grus americana]
MGTLLQYVDDLLAATTTEADCAQWTVGLLNFLGLSGYKVSQQKAQVIQQQVTYLGFEISGGQRELGKGQKEAIGHTPLPGTVKELRTFLASFLSGEISEPVVHDCLKTTEAVYSSRPNLKEEPLHDAEDSWYTDRSSFVKHGERQAGYAVTTTQKNFAGKPLEEKWNGLFQVLLTTFTTIKIKEQPAWIHYSRIKKAPASWTVESQSSLQIKIERTL